MATRPLGRGRGRLPRGDRPRPRDRPAHRPRVRTGPPGRGSKPGRGREAGVPGPRRRGPPLAADLGLGLAEIWSHAALADLRAGPSVELDAALVQFARARGGAGVGDVDLVARARAGRASTCGSGDPTGPGRACPPSSAGRRPRASPGRWPGPARCRGLAGRRRRASTRPSPTRSHGTPRPPTSFETARTRLAYGARLRRARQRVRAREHLRPALADFDHLGATLVGGGARRARRHRRDRPPARPSTRDQLTPQELQIALLLAAGRTTREAAAALFLSPKTIEYHLRGVYRKLEVGSREELAAAMGGSGGAAAR